MLHTQGRVPDPHSLNACETAATSSVTSALIHDRPGTEEEEHSPLSAGAPLPFSGGGLEAGLQIHCPVSFRRLAVHKGATERCRHSVEVHSKVQIWD